MARPVEKDGGRSYIITKHRGHYGVRLSLRGNWGNIPYPNDAAAAEAARVDAAGVAFTITRKRF